MMRKAADSKPSRTHLPPCVLCLGFLSSQSQSPPALLLGHHQLFSKNQDRKRRERRAVYAARSSFRTRSFVGSAVRPSLHLQSCRVPHSSLFPCDVPFPLRYWNGGIQSLGSWSRLCRAPPCSLCHSHCLVPPLRVSWLLYFSCELAVVSSCLSCLQFIQVLCFLVLRINLIDSVVCSTTVPAPTPKLQKALHMNLRGFAFFSYLDHYFCPHAVRTFLPLLSPTIDALLLNSATSASNVLHGVFFFLLTFFQIKAQIFPIEIPL